MDAAHQNLKELSQHRSSRRNFLRRTFTGAAGLALAGLSAKANAAKRKKPNVMIILSDDQGCVDINCFGAKDLYTPNLDALAKKGLRFTEFYMGAPVCSPSRGSLLTGRDCNINGVAGNGGSLHLDEITIAEMLKGEGYYTGLIGKWHLGLERTPRTEGFDYFFGHLWGCIENYHHNVHYWDNGKFRIHDLWRNETEVLDEDDKHFGELIVRESTDFIEKHKDEPFFLYVPFNNPHYPVQPLPHHKARYSKMKEPRRSYAAFISTLDEQVGKIIKKLDDLGLREDTLIIYMSDHGHSVEARNDLWLEEPGDYPGGGSAGPYRGHKATLWEGGIRSPCIVSMPGRVPENEVRQQIAMSLDWLPTIAEFTGTPLPERDLDGENISKVIASASAPSPHKTVHRQFRDQWFVRDGKWKLMGNAPTSKSKTGQDIPGAKRFLTDLSKDIGETTNLAERHPEIVARLEKMHEKWATDRGIDPFPKARVKKPKKR